MFLVAEKKMKLMFLKKHHLINYFEEILASEKTRSIT